MKLKRDLILILVPIVLILILVIIKSLDKDSFRLNAKETLNLSLNPEHILSVSDFKSKLSTTEHLQLLDLRESGDYEIAHLPNSVNVPFQNILQYSNFEKRTKENETLVLYSEAPQKTTKAWMILTQVGFEHLYILDIPSDLISEDLFQKDPFPEGNEVLKYKFQPDTIIALE